MDENGLNSQSNREKVESLHQGTTGNTMMQKFTSLDSLLGMPVKFSNGIADEKQQLNEQYTGGLTGIKLSVWVPCMGNRA